MGSDDRAQKTRLIFPSWNVLILKTAIQATEITENTEMKRVPHILSAHLMGEGSIYGNQLFLLCELCVL